MLGKSLDAERGEGRRLGEGGTVIEGGWEEKLDVGGQMGSWLWEEGGGEIS